MKTTLDKKGYITEQRKKSDKESTERNLVLASRNPEVRTTISTTDRTKTVKRKRFDNQQPTLVDRRMDKVLKSVTSSGSTEISIDISEAQQNISRNLNNKNSILWNLFQKARHFSNQDPNKKIAFEFLHTQDPDNIEIFEKFGTVLEIQDPKAAKELYVKGLSNNKLFDLAFQHIKFITQRDEDCAETSTLKAIFDVSLFNRPGIVQIKERLKDPSDPIHEHLKEFVNEEVKEHNMFL